MTRTWLFRMIAWVAIMAFPLFNTARSGEPIAFGLEVVIGLLLALVLARFTPTPQRREGGGQ